MLRRPPSPMLRRPPPPFSASVFVSTAVVVARSTSSSAAAASCSVFYCHRCSRTISLPISSSLHCPCCRLGFLESIDSFLRHISLSAASSSRRQGTPQSHISSIPIVKITTDHLNGDRDCAICKDDFTLNSFVRKLPCGHLFHGDCIIPWLKNRNSCPLCRAAIPSDGGGVIMRVIARVIRQLRRLQCELELMAEAMVDDDGDTIMTEVAGSPEFDGDGDAVMLDTR